MGKAKDCIRCKDYSKIGASFARTSSMIDVGIFPSLRPLREAISRARVEFGGRQ